MNRTSKFARHIVSIMGSMLPSRRNVKHQQVDLPNELPQPGKMKGSGSWGSVKERGLTPKKWRRRKARMHTVRDSRRRNR